MSEHPTPPEPDPPARVTTRDVYEAVTRLGAKVEELSGQLALERQASTTTSDKVTDHEDRIRSLERWAYAIPTTFILSALATVATIVLAVSK